VGRQWLQTYPDSPLKGEMPYYIEPAEQEPEVQAQLEAITPASIDPETIKVLDPACGSGHILVEAYNVLKAIYEERGYRSRDIPKLVLENNLFGLDIDDRAAQLAGFALLMKAREDDRRIFTRGVRLNVMALQSTQHLDASTLWRDLNLTGDWHQGQSQGLFESEQKELSSNDSTYKAIVDLIERFQDAKTFGSLIEVPNSFEAPLKSLLEVLTELDETGDTMQKTGAKQLMPVVQQAWVLAQRYDAVIANPPYMGTRNMPKKLKAYSKKYHPEASYDLYAMFMDVGFFLLKETGLNAQVKMHGWMFLGAYERLRKKLLSKNMLICLAHLGAKTFKEISGEVVQAEASVFLNYQLVNYKGIFNRLVDYSEEEKKYALVERKKQYSEISQNDFFDIPGYPLAYWVPASAKNLFNDNVLAGEASVSRKGMVTANNDKFVRLWHEVSLRKVGFGFSSNAEASESNYKWFPYLKGGDYRRWYGNHQFVVMWENGGDVIRTTKHPTEDRIHATNFNTDYIFKPGITWSDIALSNLAFRYVDQGFVFDAKSPMAFGLIDKHASLSSLNSSLIGWVAKFINPTISFQVGNYDSLPLIDIENKSRARDIVERLIKIAKDDWDSFETSWDFKNNPLVTMNKSSVSEALQVWIRKCKEAVDAAYGLELENNALVLNSTALAKENIGEFSLKDVTLNTNPEYRYGQNKSDDVWNIKFGSDSISELISYSIGCMMGRYSLDKPGLILASQGETVRDYLAQIPEPSFTPDKNAIIPLTDQEWFPDDATNRFRDFVRTVWGEEHLQENLDFVAESLCLHAIKSKKGEAALDTIRRYLSTQFFKDHLRTYKKRPIYWLFSSGKQRAFECLVYLHRYNESTLAEMRTDYVIPLTEKLASYVETLEQKKESSASAAEAKRIEKELSKLYKQQAELNAFDEKLRHYADQRISLDLDDGVKVNYGKFGNLLAEVKQVAGNK